MQDSNKEEVRLKGIPASAGIAQAKAFLLFKKELDIPTYQIEPEKIDEELSRFDEALLKTRQQITNIIADITESLGEDEAKIFDAHLLVLEDMALIGETQNMVRQTRYNVEHAFNQVSQKYIAFFNHIDDEYLKERVYDIKDVTRRVLGVLLGDGENTHFSKMYDQRILVAEDLSPSDTASLDFRILKGILTDSGSVTSHTAIIARSLRVPAIVSLHNATDHISADDDILIDGYEGLVIVNPTQATLEEYRAFQIKRESVDQIFSTEATAPALSLDDKKIPILLNIEGTNDIDSIRQLQPDGIGLFRTEGILLRDNRFVSEEEQYAQYSEVLEAADGKPVTFRTFDLGGDKVISTQNYREVNPFMGLRGIRYSLKYPDIFKTQLRAILRASVHGNTKIMYPMISGVNELQAANVLLQEVKNQLQDQGYSFDPEAISTGCMIEVPSAAATIDIITQECDFVSIGTNDLIQYLLAVDRVNDMISDLYEPCHPAVLRTLRDVTDSSHAQNVSVSVCGEMAGDPILATMLIGLGVDELSISPGLYAEIKYLVRHISVADAQRIAEESLGTGDAFRTYRILKQFYTDIFKGII